MPDFFGRMVGLMNIEANTNLLNSEAQGQQILAQERALNLQLGRQKLQDDMTYQQVLRETASGLQGPQQRGDQVIEGDEYVSGLAQELSREQQNASHLRQVATALQGSGVSLATQKQAESEAEAAGKSALAVQKEYRLAQSTLMDQIGRIAGSARDTDSFRSAYQQIAQLNPQLTRALTVDRDENGIPFFGPKSQRSMETLKYQGMNTATQMLRDQQATDEIRKQDDEVRKNQESKEKEQLTNAEIAYKRAATASQYALRDKRKADLAGVGQQYKLTKDVQGQVDKIADQYKIRDYEKSEQVAERAESALTDPARGYADVTAPAARTLADQFKLMIDNYRSRTGGRYQEQELGRMNGLLQRLDKFTETIGEGDKLLAKDVMLQTAREMKNLYVDRATGLAKEELGRLDTLKQRGGNPMWITLHTDVDNLERLGAAKKVDVDGKPYVAFPKPGTEGKKKRTSSDYDIFPLPTAPEQRVTVPAEE